MTNEGETEEGYVGLVDKKQFKKMLTESVSEILNQDNGKENKKGEPYEKPYGKPYAMKPITKEQMKKVFEYLKSIGKEELIEDIKEILKIKPYYVGTSVSKTGEIITHTVTHVLPQFEEIYDGRRKEDIKKGKKLWEETE